MGRQPVEHRRDPRLRLRLGQPGLLGQQHAGQAGQVALQRLWGLGGREEQGRMRLPVAQRVLDRRAGLADPAQPVDHRRVDQRRRPHPRPEPRRRPQRPREVFHHPLAPLEEAADAGERGADRTSPGKARPVLLEHLGPDRVHRAEPLAAIEAEAGERGREVGLRVRIVPGPRSAVGGPVRACEQAQQAAAVMAGEDDLPLRVGRVGQAVGP